MADSDSDYASDDESTIDESEFTCENVRRSTRRATRRGDARRRRDER
jgi:hypothetical protein